MLPTFRQKRRRLEREQRLNVTLRRPSRRKSWHLGPSVMHCFTEKEVRMTARSDLQPPRQSPRRELPLHWQILRHLQRKPAKQVEERMSFLRMKITKTILLRHLYRVSKKLKLMRKLKLNLNLKRKNAKRLRLTKCLSTTMTIFQVVSSQQRHSGQ